MQSRVTFVFADVSEREQKQLSAHAFRNNNENGDAIESNRNKSREKIIERTHVAIVTYASL